MATIHVFKAPYKDIETEDREDMLKLLADKIRYLTEDIPELIKLCNDYEDLHEPLDYRTLGTIEHLGVMLAQAGQGRQESTTTWLCRQCDERYNVERRERDDAWQMKQYAAAHNGR